MAMTLNMPVLPNEAVDEIMARLGESQRISSDEIVSILKKYNLAGQLPQTVGSAAYGGNSGRGGPQRDFCGR